MSHVIQKRIDHLLQDPRIWRAGQTAVARTTVASGWESIDREFDGGWPLGQLTEFLIEAPGIGELALLLPALRHLLAGDDAGKAAKWVSFVSPPYLPYAPALARAGVDLSRLLLVRPQHRIEMFWAMEQALHSGSCAAVLGWSDLADEGPLRRLQLAAAAGNAWTVLFRPSRLRELRSPAPLRVFLGCEWGGESLIVEVLKRRGKRPVTLHVDPNR